MQARRRRIETHVKRQRTLIEFLGERVDIGALRNKATPLQVFDEGIHTIILPHAAWARPHGRD